MLGKFWMDPLKKGMQLVFQLSSPADQFFGFAREGAQARVGTFSVPLRLGLDASKTQIIGHEACTNPVCLARMQALYGKLQPRATSNRQWERMP
jgi:hypothetical protein